MRGRCRAPSGRLWRVHVGYDDRYLAFLGRGPKEIPHWEHWSCPDAETYLTGIDYYEHPRLCRLKLFELYPRLRFSIMAAEEDTPIPRPTLGSNGRSSDPEHHTIRWGDGESWTWRHGEIYFKTPEDVFAFSPLANPDFSNMPVVIAEDFSSEEIIYERYRRNFPAEWGETPPEGTGGSMWFYNTMFMWPLLTFGWELFLECCMDKRFERVMDEFAEISRRVFRAFARLPIEFVISHDDITTARGPVCSPSWMHKYIFPRYQEYWGTLNDAGKKVIFCADGRMDAYADDVIACGARGIVTEPYTDFKAIARRHEGEDLLLAGEGDNRVLTRNDPDEIEAMVKGMVETAKMTGGYMMCVGNQIAWNVTPEGIKRYFECANKWAHR